MTKEDKRRIYNRLRNDTECAIRNDNAGLAYIAYGKASMANQCNAITDDQYEKFNTILFNCFLNGYGKEQALKLFRETEW